MRDDPVGMSAEFEERNSRIPQCPDFRLSIALASPAVRPSYWQSERYRRMVVSRRSVPRDVHAEHQGFFDTRTLCEFSTWPCRLAGEHIERSVAVLEKLFEAEKGKKPRRAKKA